MSENVEKNIKKNNGGILVLSILLFVVILVFAGYVLLDQGIISFNAKEDVMEQEQTKQELDINSKLVKYLYGLVADVNDGASWQQYWRYGILDKTLEDFNSKTSSEKIKMQLVAKNLNHNNLSYFFGDDGTIPENNSYGQNVWVYNKNFNENQSMTYYDREYVESVYKLLFGSDAKLDTSVDLCVDRYCLESYTYVGAHDKYFRYKNVGGGTGAPGGYITKLVKANKEGKNIYLYEDVTLEEYEGDTKSNTENFEMVYTFELDDDGMYKFVSRVKKDK